MAAEANKLFFRSPTTLALLLITVLWTSSSCALLPPAMTDDTTTTTPMQQPPAQPGLVVPAAAAGAGPTTAAAALPASPSSSSAAAVPDPESTSVSTPSATTATTPATATDATGSKKFPLPNPGGEPYLPAAEVASALPVPTPDELPSAASFGFGSNGGPLGFGGPGDECCGGGGYGWYGGPGGFGPGTYGYNGPLYFGSATPAAGLVGAINVLLPLLLAACVPAAMLA